MLRRGSKACEKVRDLLTDRCLIDDIRKLSPHPTSSLESNHSVVNHFVPKLLAFSHVRIYCRCNIVVIKFTLTDCCNENFRRQPAITKDGKERIKFYFPKAKQCECTPKITPVQPTYGKLHFYLC